jgi:hypothetical protein
VCVRACVRTCILDHNLASMISNAVDYSQLEQFLNRRGKLPTKFVVFNRKNCEFIVRGSENDLLSAIAEYASKGFIELSNTKYDVSLFQCRLECVRIRQNCP